MDETKKKALALLDRRDMSRKELTDKLLQKGETPEAVAAAADRLEELGFLNDGRYAALVVRHYAGKGYGPARVRQELQRRGVPRELWDAALEQLEPDPGRLDRLLRQRLRGRDAADRAERRRAADYLLRRGYGWEEVREALDRYREREE